MFLFYWCNVRKLKSCSFSKTWGKFWKLVVPVMLLLLRPLLCKRKQLYSASVSRKHWLFNVDALVKWCSVFFSCLQVGRPERFQESKRDLCQMWVSCVDYKIQSSVFNATCPSVHSLVKNLHGCNLLSFLCRFPFAAPRSLHLSGCCIAIGCQNRDRVHRNPLKLFPVFKNRASSFPSPVFMSNDSESLNDDVAVGDCEKWCMTKTGLSRTSKAVDTHFPWNRLFWFEDNNKGLLS